MISSMVWPTLLFGWSEHLLSSYMGMERQGQKHGFSKKGVTDATILP